MPPTLELRSKQHVALTPRLQQSVRLLQLSSLEFQHELRQALDNNPFLEYDDPIAEESESPANGTRTADGAELQSGVAADAPQTVEAADSYDGLASPDATVTAPADDPIGDFGQDWSTRGASRNNGDSDDVDPGAWAHAQPTMHEHLHNLLHLYPLTERDRAAAQIVIEALDDDGYLRESLEELAGAFEADPPLSEEELRVALRLVQTLDRPGVGARSLSECLSLQLDVMSSDTPGRDAAREIVEHHLERLARREHAELQKQLGCSAEELRTACALVRRLDPKPGQFYARSDDNYVIPDVIVRRVKGRWVASINPAVLPRARIHRVYAELFAQSGGAGSPLGQQLQEARWLLRNAEQRFTTIQRVAQCIVSYQKAFFDYGEIALKPLVLSKLAEELGLHESTVSRASSNKYMATPRGIFEFRHFFPRELATETGGRCSAAAVRALIKEMIDQEDVRNPLSDVALAKMLSQEGMIVARRTVAKYRNLLKVPPAQLRRQA
ncbi:RNA polymerase factor sigma-54 [Trinickia dabaoshanensis]|uniref:RNA polymerase sigma-54 factor n=1 Tax=Trinickia dabaoshanensis TaxID=564714 RepID=A0A2N7VNV0_9BURK|nr:RNA polymerase factor sigma-54 [Trinickia dabaoshanensis]PMS18848.1 RNA polymerase factor sigma-54 [Trinickia dabaoshanensis]